jgi:hypothetical protein
MELSGLQLALLPSPIFIHYFDETREQVKIAVVPGAFPTFRAFSRFLGGCLLNS